MDNTLIVVFITAPSKEVGEKIARLLVEKKLAACVSILAPILSIYTWEGAVQQDDEVLLIAKSSANVFEDYLLPTVREVHPYKVPEIIALPIRMGLPAYLEWINQETR